ncbi:phage tail protein [Pseudomonas sp.]|uniref:phage tail protein n=1 Tax=unclassified Pseudomonas TaxID=196821 RepID=UPI0031DF0380
MAVTYYALLTTIGAGKLANAAALGTTLKITQLAVGDGGGNVPTPDASRTALVNEVRRAPLNQLSIDPANSAQIIAEQVIPENVGGWWIREMGLYDEAGALIAYANCAPSYKPQLAEGSGRTQTVRIVLIVSNAASVELKIDPSVVLATREYVDNSIVTALNRLDCKQSVRVATTASITLSGLQTLDGIALMAGDRVLVKNQSNAADNGIYVAAITGWKRSTDADEKSDVTPGLTVSVESGISQADSIWQLVTDGAIVLGVTVLTFQNITNGLARLASPAFSGSPTAPTPAQFDNDTSIATTEFVQRAQGNLAGFVTYSASNVWLTAADVGKYIYCVTNGMVVTLPDVAVVPVGSRVYIQAAVGVSSIIINNLNGNLAGTNDKTSGADFIALLGDTSSEFISSGTAWYATGGSGSGQLSTSGYQKFPSGIIIQWGVASAQGNDGNDGTTAGVDVPIMFPMAFPNSCFIVTATHFGHRPNTTVCVRALTKSSFVAEGSEAGVNRVINYIAIGC